ncbi:MAG: DUF5004 domain-containing protein [Bacteroidota bacterium]
MMTRQTLFILLLSILSACSTTIPKQLNGTWQMTTVYDNSSDVTAQHNPQKNRWITFYKDGSFRSGGQPYGENGGQWTYNTQNNILYLDSDAGEGDDSYWLLNINKKSMDWAGTKSSFTERFKIFYTKLDFSHLKMESEVNKEENQVEKT